MQCGSQRGFIVVPREHLPRLPSQTWTGALLRESSLLLGKGEEGQCEESDFRSELGTHIPAETPLRGLRHHGHQSSAVRSSRPRREAGRRVEARGRRTFAEDGQIRDREVLSPMRELPPDPDQSAIRLVLQFLIYNRIACHEGGSRMTVWVRPARFERATS